MKALRRISAITGFAATTSGKQTKAFQQQVTALKQMDVRPAAVAAIKEEALGASARCPAQIENLVRDVGCGEGQAEDIREEGRSDGGAR